MTELTPEPDSTGGESQKKKDNIPIIAYLYNLSNRLRNKLFHEFNTVDRNIALYMQDVGFQP
jgi:hypothetical protein